MMRKIIVDMGAHPWTTIYTAIVVTVIAVVEAVTHWF